MNKRTQEQYPRLDMKAIEPGIKANPGEYFSYSITNKNKLAAKHDEEKGLVKLHDGEQYYVIQLREMACHFGGYRLYFVCRYCSLNRGVLYLKQANQDAREFACRECLNLVYKSQQATKGDYWTYFNKAESIARQLDPDYNIREYSPAIRELGRHDFPERKKYMKRVKYDSLLSKFLEYTKLGSALNALEIESSK